MTFVLVAFYELNFMNCGERLGDLVGDMKLGQQ